MTYKMTSVQERLSATQTIILMLVIQLIYRVTVVLRRLNY